VIAAGRVLRRGVEESDMLAGFSINMVQPSKEDTGKAKADPRDDLPLEFRAEEHTSVRTIERN